MCDPRKNAKNPADFEDFGDQVDKRDLEDTSYRVEPGSKVDADLTGGLWKRMMACNRVTSSRGMTYYFCQTKSYIWDTMTTRLAPGQSVRPDPHYLVPGHDHRDIVVNSTTVSPEEAEYVYERKTRPPGD